MTPISEQKVGFPLGVFRKGDRHVMFKHRAVENLLCIWGGTCGEAKNLGLHPKLVVLLGGAKNDLEFASEILEKFFPDDEKFNEKAYRHSRRIVNQFWPQIKAIVSLLKDRDFITRSDVRDVIGRFDYHVYTNEILLPVLKDFNNTPPVWEEVEMSESKSFDSLVEIGTPMKSWYM